MESFPNQFSKCGYYQPPNRPLIDPQIIFLKSLGIHRTLGSIGRPSSSGLHLESCSNQLSKLGYYQTPKIPLTDPQPIFLKNIGHSLSYVIGQLGSLGVLHNQVSIWRAVQISSPNLVTISLLTDH